ncbi:multidrug effflux MFS transporter [Pseudovibrio sp. JE062]|uniref:multidrug effflux MFS transporter n=1 Tax=Pseudovibrio sp. JE062 TaxID=439495 RepID=UPI000186C5EA|nr:multidrug effflux MFS transporter [Pseudovibrio sp. JE062]EEA96573.1 drug resistance transporter Bcr/CflA subfamily protein [Pseudovibrio sp. JE062]
MSRRTFALIIIFMLTPLGPLAIDIFLPSVPEMLSVFEATNQQMRLTIPLYIFALGFAQLVGGPISDRFGRRASAMIGLSLYALGSLGAAFAPSLDWLYGARLVQGFGASFTMVTTFAWVRDNFEGDEAGKWLSYMSGLTGSVPMIAPMIGGILGVIWGWQAAFFLMAAAGLLLLFLTPLALPPTQKRHRTLGAPDQITCNLGDMARNRAFILYSLANAATFGAVMTYVSIAPEVAMEQGGMSEMQFATILGAIGLLQMLFSFLAPRMVEMIGAPTTVLVGLSLSVISGLGLLFVPQSVTMTFFAFAALGSAGFSLMIGISTGLTLQPFPNCAGLAASIGGFLRMFGGASIATLTNLTDLQGPATLATALLFSLLPLTFLLFDRRMESKIEGETF